MSSLQTICICGSSASGKSTLSRFLTDKLCKGAERICQDIYRSSGKKVGNMECVESIDFVKFENAIIEGKEKAEISGHSYFIVEGYLSCCELPILQHFDKIIFLDVQNKETAKQRRWKRSMNKKNKKFEDFENTFETLIWPYYLKYRDLQIDNIVKSGKQFMCITVDDKEAKRVAAISLKSILEKGEWEKVPPSWFNLQ
ncbi:hypothetical protein ABK040_005884 [Willaertia magna]